MVAPARETIESALRRAERIGANNKLKNEAARARNHSARQLDALMKGLAVPLGSYERGFPQPSRLHPFERALMELTIGTGRYEKVMAKIIALRKASVEVAKGYAARSSKAANKREALALRQEGFSRVEAVYDRGSDALEELKEIAKSLRRLPVVDPSLPTVALVGAPNVGKSSLVQLLSSGLPEVQNYPFTTRSIKMGHFYVDGRRHQVTDTPGLLNRDDEDRNAMERLTLASLRYLPTAVLFVVDLTEECGTTVKDQWSIRKELKAKFPSKPWLDVFSKCDLLEEELDAADQRLSQGEEAGPSGEDAIRYAMAFKDALRISSLTGEGIDELKTSMMDMLETMTYDDDDGNVEQERHDVSGLSPLFSFETEGKRVKEKKNPRIHATDANLNGMGGDLEHEVYHDGAQEEQEDEVDSQDDKRHRNRREW